MITFVFPFRRFDTLENRAALASQLALMIGNDEGFRPQLKPDDGEWIIDQHRAWHLSFIENEPDVFSIYYRNSDTMPYPQHKEMALANWLSTRFRDLKLVEQDHG